MNIQEEVIKTWTNFVKDSEETQKGIVKNFGSAINQLDKVVEEQRQATILMLRNALGLSDGTIIHLTKDGSYKIIQKEN